MEVMLRNGKVVNAFYLSVEVSRYGESLYTYTLLCYYLDELHKENKGVIGFFDNADAALDEYDLLESQLREYFHIKCMKNCGIVLSKTDLQKAKNE